MRRGSGINGRRTFPIISAKRLQPGALHSPFTTASSWLQQNNNIGEKIGNEVSLNSQSPEAWEREPNGEGFICSRVLRDAVLPAKYHKLTLLKQGN